MANMIVAAADDGGTLSAVGKDYLACRKARQGLCTNTRSFRRPLLESLMLDGLKSRLMAPELVKEFIAEFHREVKRQRRDQEIDHGLRRRELDEVSRKVDGLINAIADGLRTPGLKIRLEELEGRKQELAALSTAARPLSLACTQTWPNSIARGSLICRRRSRSRRRAPRRWRSCAA